MLSSKKLSLLHAVRGFAAFYVVVFHAKFALWSGGKEYLSNFPRSEWGIFDYLLFGLDMLSANGTAMVVVFFVLSGFFIAFSFDKNNWDYKSFYQNRIIRIYAPFLFSLFFSIGVLYLVKAINPALTAENQARQFNEELLAAFRNLNLKNLALTLIFLPSGKNQYIGFNMVYWSLLYEAIFYLLIPVIINRTNLYLLISVATFLAAFFFKVENPLILYFLNYSIYFAGGLVLYHYLKANPNKKPLHANLLIASIAILFFGVVFLALVNQIRFSHLLAGGFCVGLILLFMNYEIKGNFILSFFKKLGVISYSLYLFHFPILILTYAIFTKVTGDYVFYSRIYWIGVIASVLIAYPVYYLLEEKTLRFLSKLKTKPAHVPVHK